jgi:multiple sugar transport system substrate-binding protein
MTTGTFSRRQFLKHAGIAGAGLALAACTTAAPGAAEPQVAGEAPAGEKQTVTIWGWWDIRMQIFADSANKYMESHPEVEIKVEALPFDELWQKVYASVAAGTGPTLLKQKVQDYFKMVDQGILVPYPEEDFPNAWLEEKYPTFAWDRYGRYIMPTGGMGPLMFYNKQMFEEAGLDPEAPPTTWDELMEAAQKLTVTDSSGLIMRAGFVPGPEYQQLDYLYQLGGMIVQREGDTLTATFDTPEMIAAYQFAKDWADTYKVWDPEFLEYAEAFGTGNAAIVIGESYVVGDWRDNYADIMDVIGYAPIPTPTGDADPYRGRKSVVLMLSIMGSRPPAETEAAIGFLNYFYKEDIDALYRKIELLALAPMRVELFEDPRVLENEAISTLTPHLAEMYDPVELTADFQKIMDDVRARILLNDEPVESAVAYGQEEWAKIIDSGLVKHVY